MGARPRWRCCCCSMYARSVWTCTRAGVPGQLIYNSEFRHDNLDVLPVHCRDTAALPMAQHDELLEVKKTAEMWMVEESKRYAKGDFVSIAQLGSPSPSWGPVAGRGRWAAPPKSADAGPYGRWEAMSRKARATFNSGSVWPSGAVHHPETSPCPGSCPANISTCDGVISGVGRTLACSPATARRPVRQWSGRGWTPGRPWPVCRCAADST